MLVGLVREILLGDRFGTGMELDAYLIAIFLPGFLANGIAAAVASAFLPVFTQEREAQGEAAAVALLSRALTTICVLVLGASILFFVLAPLIVASLAPGVASKTFDLSVSLLRVTLVGGFFWTISGFLRAVLQAERRFLVLGLSNCVTGGTVVLSLTLLTTSMGIYAVAVGMVIGHLVVLFLECFTVRGLLRRLRPEISFRDPAVRRVLHLAAPLMVGMTIAQVRLAVDRVFGSQLEEGTISAFHYARRLEGLSHLVLGASVTAALYPFMSSSVAKGDFAGFRRTIENGMGGLVALLAPLVVMFVFFGRPLVKVLLERGEFGSSSTELTATILFFLAFGTIPFVLNNVLSHGFYAHKSGNLPTLIGVMGLLINVGLCFLLFRPLGAAGLAIAASAHGIVSCGLRLYFLRRFYGVSRGTGFLTMSFRALLAASIAGAVALFSVSFLGGLGDGFGQAFLEVGVGGTVTAVLYLVLGHLFAVAWIREPIRRVRERFAAGGLTRPRAAKESLGGDL